MLAIAASAKRPSRSSPEYLPPFISGVSRRAASSRRSAALEGAVAVEAELGDHAENGRGADPCRLAEAGDGVEAGDRVVGEQPVGGAALVRGQLAEVAADQLGDRMSRFGLPAHLRAPPRTGANPRRRAYFSFDGQCDFCNVYSNGDGRASCLGRTGRTVSGDWLWARCLRLTKSRRSRSARAADLSSSFASMLPTVCRGRWARSGCSRADLDRHIAWDPGAADMSPAPRQPVSTPRSCSSAIRGSSSTAIGRPHLADAVTTALGGYRDSRQCRT